MSRIPRAAANVALSPHTVVSLGLYGRTAPINRKKFSITRISEWDKASMRTRAIDPTSFGGVASGMFLTGRHGKAEPYRHVLRQTRNCPLLTPNCSPA